MNFGYEQINKNKKFVIKNLILLFVLDIFYFLGEEIIILPFAIYFFYFLILSRIVGQGIKQNIYIIIFFLTFYFFLLGQKPILYLREGYPFNQFNTFQKLLLDKEQYCLYANMIIISLIMIYYGYHCYYINESKSESENCSQWMLNLLRVLFIISLICSVYVFLKKITIYKQFGYYGSFLHNIEVSAFVKIFNRLYILIFFVLFSYTNNKKEKFVLAALIIFTLGGLNIILGNRSAIGALFVFLSAYAIFNVKNMMITKRIFLIVVSGAIFMLLLFVATQNNRTTGDLTGGLIKKILGLFSSNGGSDSVIANTIDKMGQLDSGWKNVLYPLYYRFTGSVFKNFTQNTELIGEGVPFSNLISYLTNKELYLSGHGMGTSYIAEAFLLCGFPGIIIINMLLGRVLLIIKNSNQFGFWGPMFNYVIYIIIMLPRNSIFGSFENCLMIFTIIYLIKYMQKLFRRRK